MCVIFTIVGESEYNCLSIIVFVQRVLGDSDKKPRLIMSDLVNGTYQFTLKVTNKNGEVAEDTATLVILPNPSDRFLLQVHLDGDITQFTQVDVVSSVALTVLYIIIMCV